MDFQSYCSNFDIIGFCETWGVSNDEFEFFLPGYTNFNFSRPKKSTAIRGSGGVTVFIKDWLIKRGIIKRVCNYISESVVLLIDAKSGFHENDIILIFTYISPEYSSIYSIEDNNGIEILNTNISQIKGEYPNSDLFLAGDLNSRIKNLNDFVLDDNLLFIFGDDVPYPEDDFNMPRLSKDTEFNRFGLSFIELCCTYSIHVFNGRLFDDIPGNYTCLANNRKKNLTSTHPSSR